MRQSLSADRSGLVLGNRYRLLALVGTGASASVYLADDAVLGRRVAVKILHDALADDERFLRRFRAEARAAAALNHPHVMAVYDWGEEKMRALAGGRNVPFLITEYLGGGSLRALLGTGTRLTPAQALHVGLEAVQGLEYAHRQGLVHRDVKPANLLFDEDARLRIADFGLARALAEAHWSEPAGGLAGTAKYASPEQARGEPLDGRSDVYSLALVLVESVTGEIPFLKDTTLGTLMARLDQPIPVDEELLGELAEPLRRAGTADPAERFDATELRTALAALTESFDAAEELDLPGAEPPVPAGEPPGDITTVVPMPVPFDDGFDSVEATDEITVVGAALPAAGRRRPPSLRRPRGDRPPAAPDWAGPTGPGPAPRAAGPLDPADVTSVQPLPQLPGSGGALPVASASPWGTAGAPPRPPGPVRPDLTRWAVIVAAAMVAGAIVGGAYWWSFVRIPTYEMPALVNLSMAEAQEEIADRDWTIDRTDVYRDDTVKDQILEQQPNALELVPRGGRISLTVSRGPEPVKVPTDLPGKTFDEAKFVLAMVGLEARQAETRPDENAAAGRVISVAPGTLEMLPRKQVVGLIVSSGPAPRTIPPGLAGQPVDAVVGQLRALRLTPNRVDVFDEIVPAGTVIRLAPDSGQVARDTAVTVTVSKGKDEVIIPDLRQRSAIEASQILASLGLSPQLTGIGIFPVKETNPPAGTAVRRGANVLVTLGL